MTNPETIPAVVPAELAELSLKATQGEWKLGDGVFSKGILACGSTDTYAGPVWSTIFQADLVYAQDSEGRTWYTSGSAEAKAEFVVAAVNFVRQQISLAATRPAQAQTEEAEADSADAPLRTLMREVLDKGLIYWEPQTSRGHAAKMDMIARCEDALKHPVSSVQDREAASNRSPDIDPDDQRVTEALQAFYFGNDKLWREPHRTRQGENEERYRMAMAIGAATATPPAAPRSGDDGWQDISTAPRNDFQGDVLVFGGAWPKPTVVKNDGDWWRYRKRLGHSGPPTHWRHLPPPPSDHPPRQPVEEASEQGNEHTAWVETNPGTWRRPLRQPDQHQGGCVMRLTDFLARSTDVPFDDTTLAKVLKELPALSETGPWLAGGALRRTLQGKEPSSDFDFFFRDADQLAEFVSGLESRGLIKVRETEHHVHYRGVLAGSERDVQCIRFAFYNGAAEVIDSFDFTICMLAFDGESLSAGDFTFWDLGRSRLAIHKITYPVATMRRLLKYANQGFSACKGALAAILTATADTPELRKQIDVQYVD